MPLLTIKDPALDTGKLYTHTLSWLQISEPNQLVFTLHKKEIKLIESKNLGSTMEVFALHQRKVFEEMTFAPEYARLACEQFLAFDEETGGKYAFLPYFPIKEVATLNDKLSQLQIPVSFAHSPKGVITTDLALLDSPADTSIEQEISYMYMLTLLYGKFLAKGDQLNGIRIQIPLFGSYFWLQTNIEKRIATLHSHGIYLQSSLNRQGDKATLQISSSDWELLQIFAHWHAPFEAFASITKKEQMNHAKQLLLTFLDTQPVQQKQEIKNLIETGVMKLLEK